MSTDSSTIVYLVRHGECMGNITRTNLSPDKAILTENGQTQARLLGQHLKDEVFTAAYASPYSRALETAQIILSQSKTSSGIELQVRPALREMNLGMFEGAHIQDILQDFGASGKDLCDWTPEGGESHQVIMERVEGVFKEMYELIDNRKEGESQTILLVTHGGILHHIWKFWNESPNYNFNGWSPEYNKVTRNGAYFKIGVDKMAKGESNGKRNINMLEPHGREHLKSLQVDTLHKASVEENGFQKYKGCVQQ